VLEQSAHDRIEAIRKAKSGKSAFAALALKHASAAASVSSSIVSSAATATATSPNPNPRAKQLSSQFAQTMRGFDVDTAAEDAPPLPRTASAARRGRRVSIWQPQTSDEGHRYYHNSDTGETAWEKPGVAPHSSVAEMESVPTEVVDGQDGWQRLHDEVSGSEYLYHPESGESRWVEASHDDASLHKWVRHVDEASGHHYLVHEETGESKWATAESGTEYL